MENNHLNNESLDQLLRNYLLDDQNIHFTEKEMDMNAAMVFSAQTDLSLPMEKEKVLLNDLEALLKSRGAKRAWWLWTLLLLLVCGVIGYFVSTTSTPVVNATVQPKTADPVDGGFDPVPYEGSDGASPIIEYGPFIPGTVEADTIANDDSVDQQDVPVNNYVNPGHTRMHIPEPIPYEEYPVLAPDPVFTAKPSPDNFKVSKGTFHVDTFNTGGTMFVTRHSAVSINYYVGDAFRSGMGDFIYVNYGAYAMKGTDRDYRLPWPVMCYADTAEAATGVRERQGNRYGFLKVNAIPQKAVRLATEPFYFSKYEVTNKEYNEFLEWVKESNGYKNRPMVKVTFDTIPSDTVVTTGEWLVIKGKYYKMVRHTNHVEDYNKAYRYIFFNPSDELLAQLGSSSLNVFPDTLSWINDFTFSYNQPMSAMYRWHPAYDDYPVVGISWFQAMAFLDWKTFMHQKHFDVQNVPYMIEYSLPSEIEWELVTLMRRQDGENVYDFRLGCNEGWMSNLAVQYTNDDAYDRPDYLKNLFTKDQYFRGDYIADGFFHTGSTRIPKNAERHVGPLDITWMDGNVSEWMMESYAENWKPFFDRHQEALAVDKREPSQLAQQIEKLYDKGNARNGRLVRGSNWYDERFGSRPGSNLNEAGLSPRRYIDPKEQHSTVGFRYVIRVKFKDEETRLQ